MRAFEFLQESQGGIFRRAQEVGQGTEVRFKNAQTNHEISLVSAQMVPPTGEYQTEEELDQGLQGYLKPIIGPNFMQLSQFTGNPSKARAALVSIWKEVPDPNSPKPAKPILHAFIKLVKKVGSGAAPVLQTNADFKKDFGYGAGGKTAQRQTLQLKPKYVLETNTWLTVQGVVQSVTNTISNRSDLDPVLKNGLVQLVKEVAQGKSQPVPGMAEYETSLEVDYGEIPAPIALLTGRFVSGDYQKAEQGLLKPMGLSWGQLKKILYPDAGDEKLYDSYIQIDSKNKLRISSKDKKGGAAASVTGLVDEMNNTPEKYQDITDDKKFQPLIQMLKTIANPPNMYWNRSNKGINGPLILGVDTFKFIDADDAKKITSLMNDPKLHTLHPDVAFKEGIISQNLHNLIPVKGAKYNDPAYNLGYHLMACVAKNIANIVNKDPNTDALFRTILERSNMIQVKTTVKSTGDAAAFTDFKVIYPPIFEGRFLMIADNNYMATRQPIAPLSFAIK